MRTNANLDDIRRAALDQADRGEKAWKVWLLTAGLVEAGCLLGFFLLADFKDRTHVLLLVVALLVYGTLALGMLSLGAFTQAWCRRLLTAIELVDRGSTSSDRSESQAI